MRTRLWLSLSLSVASLIGPATLCRAQDGGTPDEVKKMYQDALVQLKSAQDRKNELANDNAKLAAHVADLEKQIEQFKRLQVGEADRTFFLRSRYAAWETFMKQYPDLMERWKLWMGLDSAGKPGTLPALGSDGDWPFSGNDEG